MIDLSKESLLTVKDARKELPGRPSINTIYRWFWKGVRGIKLESVRVGGRVFTSKEACCRFVKASSQVPSVDERFMERDAIRQAQQFLDVAGVRQPENEETEPVETS